MLCFFALKRGFHLRKNEGICLLYQWAQTLGMGGDFNNTKFFKMLHLKHDCDIYCKNIKSFFTCIIVSKTIDQRHKKV